MRFTAAAIIAVLSSSTGCSFVGVRGPKLTEPVDAAGNPIDPKTIHCTESDILPALDALGGAGALAVAGGGIILEKTSDDGSPKHFTAYYAGPLVALAVLFFYSASFGTDRVSRCTELKESKTQIIPITSIDSGK